MGSPDISSHELLRRLQKEPHNEELIHVVATRINDPARQKDIEHAAHAVMKKQPSWSNCIGQQKCSPKKLLQPTSRNDLVNAVEAGISEGLLVRAVGSGHSFSNVCPTDGILLDPHRINAILAVDASLLYDPSMASFPCCAESGIIIKDLNKALDKAGKALVKMGACGGQT